MAEKWVSIWGNAMSIVESKVEGYAKEITLRYPIDVPFDGKGVRLTLDNFTGTEEVSFETVSVGIMGKDQNVLKGSIKKLTFNGENNLKLKPRENKQSDPIQLEMKKGDCLAISIYIKDYAQMRSGVLTFGPLSRGFYSIGDQSETEALPPKMTRDLACVYFLSRVDIYCDEMNQCLICYGDSITAQAWSEHLKLMYMEKGENTTTVRKGISGSRILRQYDNLHYESFGFRGLDRFEHEIDVCGAKAVIILHGINDIIQPVGIDVNPFRPWDEMPDLNELIEGLSFYIQKAKERGLKVYMGTLLPMEGWRTYATFRNELRKSLNEWIRNNKEIDGYIDFDAKMRDSAYENRLNPLYDSGDHLHPNDEGHKKMAEIVYQYMKDE